MKAGLRERTTRKKIMRRRRCANGIATKRKRMEDRKKTLFRNFERWQYFIMTNVRFLDFLNGRFCETVETLKNSIYSMYMKVGSGVFDVLEEEMVMQKQITRFSMTAVQRAAYLINLKLKHTALQDRLLDKLESILASFSTNEQFEVLQLVTENAKTKTRG